MNTDNLLALVVFAAVLVPFSLWLGSVFLSRQDDEAAGVKLGQVSHEEDSFQHSPPPSPWPMKHFISACMYCHHVTRSDSHPVRVGDELRVSHGICPACMATKHPEVANVAELAHA